MMKIQSNKLNKKEKKELQEMMPKIPKKFGMNVKKRGQIEELLNND